MKKTLTCGRIGAVYGVLTGCFLAVCLALLYLVLIVYLLIRWPADADIGGAVGAVFSLLLFFLVLVSIFGYIGGFLFGALGATINRPLGWLFSGMVGGAAFAGLNIGLLQAGGLTHVPSFVIGSVFCVALFGLMGFVVSRALDTGIPELPKLEKLRRALSSATEPLSNEAV